LIALKYGCGLTDALATRRFALLVKSLQRNKKIQCGNSCWRMLILFELFGAVFLIIWRGKSVPTPLFIALDALVQYVAYLLNVTTRSRHGL